MNYKYYFICATLSAFLITSCSKNEEVSSSVSAPLTGGFWISNCNYDGTAKGIRFDGTNFNDAIIYFTDSSCNTVSYITERIGTYTLTTNDAGTPQLSVSGNFDKTVTRYAITPVASATVASMNSISKCGFTDWTAETLKEVTGLNCGNGILTTVPEYDIYDYMLMSIPMMGNPGDLLFGYFDGANDGSTAEKRPTGFSANYVFKKYDQDNMSYSETNSFNLTKFYLGN